MNTTKAILIASVALLLCGCATVRTRPMSTASRVAIERANAEMREAVRGTVWAPTK